MSYGILFVEYVQKSLTYKNKKVKRKNHIFEYYSSSLEELMRIIRKQLNNEKPPNLVEN